ncbi:MAG: pyridoxal-phosphate dependent enzyme, partial [Chloroflexi bacterium]
MGRAAVPRAAVAADPGRHGRDPLRNRPHQPPEAAAAAAGGRVGGRGRGPARVSANLDFARAHLGEVQAAAERVKPHIRRTPALATDLDPRLVLKAECFQVTGSFKARGAFNAVLKLPAGTAGVVTASSGNHAQAVALAARTAGLKALILIPEGANPTKVAATKALGAEVVSDGITFANRDQKLEEAVAESGYTLIHPYDD